MKYTLKSEYVAPSAEGAPATPAAPMTKEVIMAMKLPLQLREIAVYCLENYGNEEIEQEKLFADLDSHQTDNKVLSRTPAQPISRVMAFYRGRLDEVGLFSTTKTPKVPKVPKEKVAKTDADGNPIVKPAKKSKKKMAEEATESGAITTDQAAEFTGSEEGADAVM